MAYSAFAVANYILDMADRDATPVTPMKLQKLVYFGQGWHLAIENSPLIKEQIEAWTWGPVVRCLWHEFKGFADQPITNRAIDIRFINGQSEVVAPNIDGTDPADAFAKALLARVWEIYSGYTPAQLSAMTHQAGTPWHQVYEQYGRSLPLGADIPQDSMRQYFKALAQGNS